MKTLFRLAAISLFAALSLAAARADSVQGKPLDLKFTAVDGRAVDFAKLRGKVVLVDFWATWCPPCRIISPDIVALYTKYHAQGLEVVGVSVDSDKSALLKFIADAKEPWPQYFDGKGADTEPAARFAVASFPTLWLVGKDGTVVDDNFRQLWVRDSGIPRTTAPETTDKLDAAIEKQLKTP